MMPPSGFNKRAIETLILWVIPACALLISFFYWRHAGRVAYFGYLFLAPVVFAALAVGVAAGPMKLWRWQPSIAPRILFIHRPVVYAAYFVLISVLTGRLLVLPTTVGTAIEATLVSGLIGTMVGVLHDIFGVDVGLYRISGHRFDRDVHGAIVVVARYGFYFFGFIGLTLGFLAKAAHYFLYESPEPRSWIAVGILFGFFASVPILLWGAWRYAIKTRKHPQAV